MISRRGGGACVCVGGGWGDGEDLIKLIYVFGKTGLNKQYRRFVRSIFVSVLFYNVGRALRKHVFGHMRSAKAQISLRIRAILSGPLTESLGTTECVNGEQMPG